MKKINLQKFLAAATIGEILEKGRKSNQDGNLNFIMVLLRGDILTTALYFFGAIAVIMILYGAFLYVTSFGEESKAETAKKTILWSVIGLTLVILSRVIMNIFNKELGGP